MAYLPVSSIGEFRKGSVVYGPETPPASVYLVLVGKVKVSRLGRDGQQVILDVYQTDEFFGESCLVGSGASETATALETVRVMSWSATEVRDIMLKRPELGFAFLQLAIQRSLDFGNRIQSLSLHNIERRAIAALLRFAAKFGTATDDGGMEMIAFTHQVLSEYVGTSREIVTHYMNAFRRKGCLDYSRKSIIVFEDALRNLIAEEGSSSKA